VKAFKAIAGSKDRDLAPLYTKIKQKEPEEFQEKQVQRRRLEEIWHLQGDKNHKEGEKE
jgi:hypothetical protein